MASNGFDFGSFFARFAGALVLVAATWNPTGYSYGHWLNDTLPRPGPIVVLVGIVILIGWVIFLRSTFRALGTLGLILAVALFGTLIWMVVDFGWVQTADINAMAWLLIAGVAAVMATGLSWSHIRRRLSGQVDVDDIEEN
ncbi:MAG: DUF6524 family protein [Gammaproteobacteria bacterium]